MNLNFINNVISIEALKKADLEIIESAVKKGKKEAYQIRFINYGRDKIKKALEIVNNARYNNCNHGEKLIILSNIIFIDDKKFADALLEYNIDEEDIYLLNNLINKIKLLKKQNPDVKVTHELLTKIINISKKYFGISCPNIVINKMNELVVTNPQLFNVEKKEKKKVLALN